MLLHVDFLFASRMDWEEPIRWFKHVSKLRKSRSNLLSRVYKQGTTVVLDPSQAPRPN